MAIHIAPLTAADHTQWLPLARGYKAFYQTATSDAEYDTAWTRLLAGDGVQGLGASLNCQLVGITHYLFHSSTWAPGPRSACYLQDLFTDPAARGQGVARALFGAVADAARAAGSTRCYWLTQDNNTTARRLYDQVAQHRGFIRYDLVV
jgi:GNAT superfamily N-acetyltransferase